MNYTDMKTFKSCVIIPEGSTRQTCLLHLKVVKLDTVFFKLS